GRADAAEHSGHSFDVVRQHIRARIEYFGQLFRHAAEVGDQQLDAGGRVQPLDRAHRLGVEPGAAVGKIVAGDSGDRGITQAHRLHALRDPARLVAVQRGGFAGVDLTEIATPSAVFATDEEGGLAVFPAFVDVRTPSFFAHRVQTFAPH